MIELHPIDSANTAALAQLTQIFAQSREQAMPWLDPADVQTFFTQCVAQEQQLWGAFEDENLLGFIAYTEGWIHHLYISPTARRQGVGSQLLEKALSVPGPKKLYLLEGNEEAYKFYAANGFGVIQGRKDPKDLGETPNLLYVWGRGAPVPVKRKMAMA